MAINVGRIDAAMAGRNACVPGGEDSDDAGSGVDFAAFAAAAGTNVVGQAKHVATRQANVACPPRAPLLPLLPMHLVRPVDSVEAALELFAGLDPAVLHRVLAGFLGGVIDAGQLAYLLGTSEAIALDVIDQLDEVGDRRVGAEELEVENVMAALEELRSGGF